MQYIDAEAAINRPIQVITLSLASFLLAAGMSAQQTTPAKEATPQKQTGAPQVLGESYVTLLPEQKRLVDDFVRRYNQTTGNNLAPEQAYNGARLSVRTTFDAVTHALLSTKITNEKGQNLGLAIDLVDALDQVLGQQAGVGGDRQFSACLFT